MIAIATRRPPLSRQRKLARLQLIKERYRKVVLEPKQQIAIEIASEFGDDPDEMGYMS
ncbi:MAG: hypothetical protein GXP25_24000 [Planctomycetes bacterium]|nr:hypothetical protein [Planctomycetota bacterium]